MVVPEAAAMTLPVLRRVLQVVPAAPVVMAVVTAMVVPAVPVVPAQRVLAALMAPEAVEPPEGTVVPAVPGDRRSLVPPATAA
jgi:hypothetical protein